MVSRLCFGSLTIGPLQTNMSPAEGAALIEYAAERGVNFLDTAELYDNYAHIARALRAFPDLVIATKSYAYDRETAQRSLEKALRGIGRDYVDIMMLHEQESAHTLRGHGEALEYWQEMQEKGYIGHLGISTHHIAAVRAALAQDRIEVIHPIINITGLGIQDGSRAEMEAALRDAKRAGKGIYGMKPLGGGHFIAKRQEAFAYALSREYLSAIAVGMQNREEIDYNIALFSGETPDEATAIKKRQLWIQDYCEGCGACVAACAQRALGLRENRAYVDSEKCVLCGYCAPVCPLFCIKVL